MEALEAIFTRRSVRKFTQDPVSEESVRTMLEAAMNAPSAGNGQPWHFVVVTERNLLERAAEINPNAAMARHAPMGILVSGDEKLERFPGYWVQDCSAALQNLLLAAHALGLGAVWTGIHPKPDRVEGFRELFSLPPRVHPLGLVVLGHPDQPTGRQERYRGDRVHRNRWQAGHP